MATRITMTIEDVNGSFARLIKEAPKEARAFLSKEVSVTTFAVFQRMQARVRSIAYLTGDMHDALEARLPKGNRLHGQAGVWDPEQAQIAIYNEWAPNKQAFARPAAADEAEAFKQRSIRALKKLESAFSV